MIKSITICLLWGVIFILLYTAYQQNRFINTIRVNWDSLHDLEMRDYYQKQGKFPDTLPVIILYADTSLYGVKRMKGYNVSNAGSGFIKLDSNKRRIPEKYYIFNYWITK